MSATKDQIYMSNYFNFSAFVKVALNSPNHDESASLLVSNRELYEADLHESSPALAASNNGVADHSTPHFIPVTSENS